MRIISGKWRGKPIKTPSGLPIRPTTDMAKEALFNILENRFDFSNMEALDLFSGSGNISYELISRGCISVLAIEKAFTCCQFIRSTIEELKIENLKLIQGDVFKSLERIQQKFDFIFADPPYSLPNLGQISQKILEFGLLKEGGVLVLEHPSLILMNSFLGFQETRKYGSSSFSFFS